MAFDPSTYNGQPYKMGDHLQGNGFGGIIIMIAKLFEGKDGEGVIKRRFQYTVETPGKLYILEERIF